MSKHFQNKSFTLIEMLVVVVIIGILAGVLVPRLVGARERASDAGRIVKVGQISSAVELYAQEQGSKYPLAVLTGAPGISIATPSVSSAISSYLTTIPTDPGKGTVAISGALGNIMVTGDSFAYWTNNAGTGYAITALMESKKGNTTNAVGLVDSDKQGGYQVVGKGLSYSYALGGKAPIGVTQDGTDLIISDGTNTYVIMDRNLGATEVGTGINSYGYYFQWGNNFGFPSTIGYYTPNSTGQVDASAFGPDNPYISDTLIYGLTLINADRTNPQNNNLRGDTYNTNVARKGPCPSGYHIASALEREGLIATRRNIYTTGINNGTLFAVSLMLPMAGGHGRGAPDVIFSQGGGGYYWTSSPSTVNVNARSVYFASSFIYSYHTDLRLYGFPIRCFKN